LKSEFTDRVFDDCPSCAVLPTDPAMWGRPNPFTSGVDDSKRACPGSHEQRDHRRRLVAHPHGLTVVHLNVDSGVTQLLPEVSQGHGHPVTARLAGEEVLAPSLPDRGAINSDCRLARQKKQGEGMHSALHQKACPVVGLRSHKALLAQAEDVVGASGYAWGSRPIRATVGHPPGVRGQQRIRSVTCSITYRNGNLRPIAIDGVMSFGAASCRPEGSRHPECVRHGSYLPSVLAGTDDGLQMKHSMQ
jgi:hypothetical protein